MIVAAALCSCGTLNKSSSDVIVNSASYNNAVEAIMARDFVMTADIIGSPYGNNPNPDPRESFLFLRGGRDGHFQVGVNGYVISGPATGIRTTVRKNGNVDVSMTITSDLSSINSVSVSITMNAGDNLAAASIFLERLNYKLNYTMNGRIYPIDGMSLHVAPERLQTGNFGNPFSYN